MAGKSIADVLDMTVEEGVEFFKAIPNTRKLDTMKRLYWPTFALDNRPRPCQAVRHSELNSQRALEASNQ